MFAYPEWMGQWSIHYYLLLHFRFYLHAMNSLRRTYSVNNLICNDFLVFASQRWIRIHLTSLATRTKKCWWTRPHNNSVDRVVNICLGWGNQMSRKTILQIANNVSHVFPSFEPFCFPQSLRTNSHYFKCVTESDFIAITEVNWCSLMPLPTTNSCRMAQKVSI